MSFAKRTRNGTGRCNSDVRKAHHKGSLEEPRQHSPPPLFLSRLCRLFAFFFLLFVRSRNCDLFWNPAQTPRKTRRADRRNAKQACCDDPGPEGMSRPAAVALTALARRAASSIALRGAVLHTGLSLPPRAVAATFASGGSWQWRALSARPAVTVFSEDEEALREHVARFSREVLGPKVAKMDAQEALDPDVVEALFEQGVMGIEAPSDYGGVGLGFTAACLAVEEIARVDPAVAVLVDIQNTLLITALMRYGTDEQKEKYLTRLCTDTCGSFCLSEPSSGSDAFAMKTKAARDEGTGEWVINGGKCWISNANEAGLFVVFANADPEKGHKGITSFIVERSNPGLSVGRKEDKLGIRASSTCELQFDNCRVRPECVLGPVGSGYKMAIDLLNEGRIGIGAQMVGLARGAFDAALPHMHERKQFGSAIADFQVRAQVMVR